MVRKFHVPFHPSLRVRIGIIILCVLILASAIAAGVAVGVISKSTMVKTEVLLVGADMSLVVDRLITTYELDEFYNVSESLQDFNDALNEQLIQYFSVSYVKVIISKFSGEPIVANTRKYIQRRRIRQLEDRPSIITLSATAYFLKNYTGLEIRAALKNYTPNIILRGINGQPSPGLGRISLEDSVFNDTHPTDITLNQIQSITSIPLTIAITTETTSVDTDTIVTPLRTAASTNTTRISITTTTTVATLNDMAILIISLNTSTSTNTTEITTTTTNTSTSTLASCQSFVQAYMSVTFERYLTNNEHLVFYDPLFTWQYLATNLTNQLTSYFRDSFVKLDVLLFSNRPTLISNTINNGTNAQTAIITIICRTYFVQNQTSIAIRTALANFTQPITLLNLNNQSSTAEAVLSSEYSLFTDTFSRQLTNQQMNEVTLVCRTHWWITVNTSTSTTTPTGSTNTTLSSTPTPTTTTAKIINTSNRCQSFFRTYMSVNLVRSVSSNETAQFNNRSSTVADLSTTLNLVFKSYFPQSFLKLNILMMVNEPIIISSSDARRKKREIDQPALIILVGNAYFTQNQTKEDIGNSLVNYNLSINLIDVTGQASAGFGVFSSGYSIFADTAPVQLTEEETNELTPYC